MKDVRLLLACLLVTLLTACADRGPGNDAFEFHDAAERLATDLMSRFGSKQLLSPVGVASKVFEKATGQSERDIHTFVIDPFVDSDTGNVTQASEEIASIFTATIEGPAHDETVLPLSPPNVARASYVITGTVTFEETSRGQRKRYKIYAAVVDIDSGRVMANSAVWISNAKIDDTPQPFYQNSPMYLKDRGMKRQVDVARARGTQAQAVSYVRSLDAATTTSEAALALSRAEYPTAISLFNASLERPDGKTMKNYSGLYQAYYRSNQRDAAGRAFQSMLALAVANRDITLKFLFSVGSTQFIDNADAVAQYNIWLQQTAQYLQQTGTCMTVVGHTSHTGSAEFNMALSLARAQRIASVLHQYAPSASLSTLGRGFEENLRGTGTDDEQDAVDRRVEFRTGSCQSG